MCALTGKSKAKDPYYRRANVQPGLSGRKRSALLRRWKRQGRTCAYCPNPAETVDHVVPLKRGGTNFEGNLTPACRRCNSRKGALLVVEFRLKYPGVGGAIAA